MRKSVLLAAAALALAACSKEDNAGTQPGGEKAIVARSGVATKALQTTATAQTDITFLRVDRVDEGNGAPTDFSKATSGNDEITGCSREATSGKITWGSTQNYDRTTDKNAYFVGYWPTPSGGVTAGTSVVWTIDGKTDILKTDVWDAGNYSAPKQTGMEFKHLLARLEVVCKAATGDDQSVTDAAWGKVTKIEVLNVHNAIKYDYAAGTVAAEGTANNTFALLKSYDDTDNALTPFQITANAANTPNAVAMLVPVAGTSLSLQVTTQKDGEEAKTHQPVAITLDGNFEAGKVHTVTLTFNTKEMSIECTQSTIDDWQTGGSGSGSLEN